MSSQSHGKRRAGERRARIEARATVRPEFYDLDPMNVVWHGNHVRYFEVARCLLLERIGYTYQDMLESGYAWPVVDLRLRYYRPLRLSIHCGRKAWLRKAIFAHGFKDHSGLGGKTPVVGNKRGSGNK
jgi:acyl-CoA thioesterase FadM